MSELTMREVKQAALLAVMGLLVFPGLAISQNLYKWVDEYGNVTYQDTPPPNSVEYEEQNFSDPEAEPAPGGDVGQELNDAIERNPVTLYSIPECDACDLVRLFLENHSVPFAEKDIQGNLSYQQELQAVSGQLTVPTILVGSDVVDGYSRSGIRTALTSNGYPMDQLAEGGSGEQTAEVSVDGELSDNALDSLSNVFEDEELTEGELESEEFEPEQESIIEIQAE